MLTKGTKFWLGLCLAAMVAAAFAGYTTGGDETGPLTLGWKGAVGNHIVYGTLMMMSAASGLLAMFASAFRDADTDAVAQLLDSGEVPDAQINVGPSLWPVLGAAGFAVMMLGLVLHPAVFVAGLLIVSAMAIEWTMTNWSEKLTGDPVRNREMRENLLRPIEIPLLSLMGIGVLVLAVSRILLASSVNGAVVVATVIGVGIFALAFFISARPAIPRGVLQSILALGFVAIIVGGIVAAANGEREFHQKGGTSDDAHVETDH
ncbi:MAG TPA: hypothetical protein EYG34_01870 [Acidimicrobiia bacterium]|jgi:hypothetical protein|nr:hypothetical protein [Acidimicrobiia bacterium]HIL45850.1 hypothetical protein [Acidimicrobiia bacterium]